MELGSEYNLDLSSLSKKSNNLFTYLSFFQFCIYYDSGRSALREFVTLLRDGEEVLLPEFICESVINCFDRNCIKFYRIKNDFTIDLDDLEYKINRKSKVILLMHYFGALQPLEILKSVRDLADKNNCIILEDTTHSIFSARQTIGDYMVCSIRKWMPISQGGVLYSKSSKIGFPCEVLRKSRDNYRITGFVLKDLYLKEQLDCNNEYRQIFSACEKRINDQEKNYLISDLNKFIISCIDTFELIEKRKHNAAFLANKLIDSFGILPAVSFMSDECPFVLPIRINNRDDFRSYLIDKKVYCAVHWPADGIMENERCQSVRNSRELLSLPIDQRYNENDLTNILQAISTYGSDLLS